MHPGGHADAAGHRGDRPLTAEGPLVAVAFPRVGRAGQELGVVAPLPQPAGVGLEDALAPPDRERFLVHLDGCEACAVYVDQIRRTVTIVGTVTGDDAYEVDEETLRGLVGRFRDRHAGP